MRHSTALAHFKTDQAIADALGDGKTRQAVQMWRKKDIIPKGPAALLQLKTGGLLQIDESLYKKPRKAA